jgi:hypothetical protein
MTQTIQPTKLLGPLAVVGLLGLMSYWGGTASPGPLFVLGVGLFLTMKLGLMALIWWLFIAPLAQAVAAQDAASASLRFWLASFAAIAGMLFTLGGVWDEIWHRRYGGFGQDFLWPPHLLLYSSIALIALFAFGGCLYLALKARGSLRQRVRAEPALSLLALVAGYLILSLPTDELWHRIYGRDLTAWSLPHLTIAFGLGLVLLLACALLRSLKPLPITTEPKVTWGKLGTIEVFMVLLAIEATTIMLQVGTAEWEGLRSIPQSLDSNSFRAAFWARPEWLYPVVILSIGLFVGQLLHGISRRFGLVALVGLGVFGYRLLVLALLGAGGTGLGTTSQLLAMIPMLALDLWALAGQRLGPTARFFGGIAVSWLVFFGLALPIIANNLVYPRINGGIIPAMLVGGAVMAVLASLAGQSLGLWLLRLHQNDISITNSANPASTSTSGQRLLLAPTVAFVVAIALAGVLVLTAKAPV